MQKRGREIRSVLRDARRDLSRAVLRELELRRHLLHGLAGNADRAGRDRLHRVEHDQRGLADLRLLARIRDHRRGVRVLGVRLGEVDATLAGQFRDAALGTVPVNFLTSADTTGGNSGSAVMNGHGELIGLNFDSTYESITKDWYFDRDITRAIHLDIRYMLWVMKEVDHADNLLKEMNVE